MAASTFEVEVLGEPGVVGAAKLVRVAAFHDPSSRRGGEQPDEETVDRDHEIDPARDQAGLASGIAHSDARCAAGSRI